jgi:hypothetical protein
MGSHSRASRVHNFNAPRHLPVTAALYRAWTGAHFAGQDGREKA